MSSRLQEIRNKLQKINEERRRQQECESGQSSNENTSENITVPDHATWLAKIAAGGNKPEDWLAFTEHMNQVRYSSDTIRFSCLSNYYSKAMKAVPADGIKRNEAYAKIMVNCANLKSTFNAEDARTLFATARCTCKTFALVHVAAAQLELTQGDKDKARKILEKAKDEGAQPTEMITLAFRNLMCGHQELLPERDRVKFEQVADQENKKPVSDFTPQGEHSRVIKHDDVTPLTRQVTGQKVKEISPLSLEVNHATSVSAANWTGPLFSRPRLPKVTSSASTPVDSSISLSFNLTNHSIQSTQGNGQPISRPAKRERNPSSSGDEGGDTIPWQGGQSGALLDLGRGQSQNQARTASQSDDSGRSIRSYNSTPDCKSASLLSASGRRKKAVTGKPMRVLKRSSLPQLREGQSQNDLTEDLQLQPLPETSILEETLPEENASERITADVIDRLPSVSEVKAILNNTQEYHGFSGYHSNVISGHRDKGGRQDLAGSDAAHIHQEAAPHNDKYSQEMAAHGSHPRAVDRESSLGETLEKMDTGSQPGSASMSSECMSIQGDSGVLTQALQPKSSATDTYPGSTSSTGHSLYNSKSSTLQNTCIEKSQSTTRELLQPTSWSETGPGKESGSGQVPSNQMQASDVGPDHQPQEQAQNKPSSTRAPVSVTDVQGMARPDATILESQRPALWREPAPLPSAAPPPVAAPPTVAAPPSAALPHPAAAPPPAAAPWGLPAQPKPAPTPQETALQGFMCTPMGKKAQFLSICGKTHMVLRLIGRGGFSKVYETFDPEHNLRAVKCVSLDCADGSTINSYKNEIELLQRLQYSDKIISLYDYDYQEDNNMLYVVMERGDTDLATFFRSRKKHGGLDRHTLKYYWKEMLQAVQVLHTEGIVHSDLKPANFLLVAGMLKLIDFGIANTIQQDMTSVTLDQQVGTLNYMSPEAILDTMGGTQVDEHGRVKPKIKISVKADVWSLGCILYNLVYGRTPFHHITNQIMKLQAIINPNNPILFPACDDKEVLDVLQKCLIRDPKQRPSIKDLLEHRYLTGT